MKRIKCMACLMLCLLLWGCSQKPNEETTPQTPEVTQVTTTAPVFTETTAPTEPEPTLPQAAVTEYPEVVFSGYISVMPVDETHVALVSGEYAEEDREDYSLWIMDLCSGTLSAPMKLPEEQYPSVQDIAGSRILLEDTLQQCYVVLDEKLQTVETVSVPELFGFFTADMSQYYYVQGDSLMVLDTATGESQAVSFTGDLHISYLQGYDSARNILLFEVSVDPFSYDCCNAALDMNTGELLIFSSLTGYQKFSGDGIVVEEYNPDTDLFDLYCYTYGSDTYRKVPGEAYQTEYCYTSPVGGTNYLLMTRYDEEYLESDTVFFRYGNDLGVSPSLAEALNGTLESALPMPDGSLLCSYVDAQWNYRLALLRPEEFPFEPVCLPTVSELPPVDLQLKEQYDRVLEGPELSPELAKVRAKADAIEEDFGITVLISNQCTDAAEGCSYPMVTTDQVEWMDESWYISDALSILRRSLELYPEDFFRQFRWDNSSGGLLVLLVEDIQSENNAIGVSYSMNNWYPIAVDITSYDLQSTYCHELWHATEDFISDHDYTTFNDGTWDAMNPEGFAYSYSGTMDYLDDTEWTYFDGWYYTQSYFVDSYSRVNGKEDRARLMEYIMTYEEEARSMMEAPVLYEKLGYLCTAIRQHFDTTGWENVWWERFHEESWE